VAAAIAARDSGGDATSDLQVCALLKRRTRACRRKVSLLQAEHPMTSENKGERIRNPFGVMDVPDPNDQEVMQFAGVATLEGSSDDENAAAWGTAGRTTRYDTIEGDWSSRWNGGADPTIAGDAADKWKQGRAKARIIGEYLSVVRLGFRRAQRPHRCEARGPATAGRKIHQSKQPGDHTALDRQNRERAENRRTLAARTPGFPQIEISERRHSDRTARSAEPTSAKNVTSGYQERGASLRLPTRKRLAKFRQCRLRSIGPVDSIWASDHFAVVADLDVRADSATQPP
jgi:hypothetical protein